MEANTTIAYEIGIVEQCSPFENFTKNILSRYEIENWTFKNINTGIGFGLNAAWHGVCSAPYILSLEDDWLFIGPNRWLERGIDVLQYYDRPNATYKVLGVFGSYNSGIQKGPLYTDNNTTHRVYMPELMDWEHAFLLTFCNGGTLASAKSLREVGLQLLYTPLGTEAEFKLRALNMGYRMAALSDGGGWERAFQHLGHGRHLGGNKHRRRIRRAKGFYGFD